MKVIVRFGNYVAYDVSCLDILAKGIPVESDGYGSDAKYLPKKDTLEFDIIHDHQLVTEEKDTIEALRKKLAEKEKTLSDQYNKVYSADNRAKELEKELAVLRGVCPHTEPKNETAEF